jgi:hypothetical protein
MTALAYTVADAATATSVSEKTITRAIRKWQNAAPDKDFPPPLPAKRKGRSYMVLASELQAWVEKWPDA